MKATHPILGIACTLLVGGLGACATAPDAETEPASDTETTSAPETRPELLTPNRAISPRRISSA